MTCSPKSDTPKLFQLFELILLHAAVLAAPAVVVMLTDFDLFDRLLDRGALCSQPLDGAKLRDDLFGGCDAFSS